MNLSTAIVSAFVLALFVWITVMQRRRKKQGKSACSCGCSGCAMEGRCHK